MGSKKLKIVACCLGLSSLAPLTACSTTSKEQEKEKEKEKLDSIQILSDINNIRLEVNETYLSKTIEIKCLSQTKKEIEADTQLFLYPLEQNNIDIKIENKQIKIGLDKRPGLYKYKLAAVSQDLTIISNIKEFNVEVYKAVVVPDQIELSGTDSINLEYPTSKTFEYQLIAKSKGQILEEFDPRTSYEVNVVSSSTGKTKDQFNNPIFSLEQLNKTFTLKTSQNIDKSYEGNYCLELKTTLLSNPSITSSKTVNVKLMYGIEYIDRTNNYIYSRESIESEWYLKSIPSNSIQIDKNILLKQINGVDVNKIGNNFCTNSSIKTFLILDTPEAIKIIGSYAFYKQEALNSFYIQNIEGVGESAFEGCTLGSINPQWQLKLKYVAQNAFKDCRQFEPKYLPDIVYLGESCFRGIGSSEIHFGSQLSLICVEALYDCPNLKDVYISSTQPPQLMGDFIGGTTPTSFKIHVPSSAIDTYRNDQNWSIYSQNLVGDITM